MPMCDAGSVEAHAEAMAGWKRYGDEKGAGAAMNGRAAEVASDRWHDDAVLESLLDESPLIERGSYDCLVSR